MLQPQASDYYIDTEDNAIVSQSYYHTLQSQGRMLILLESAFSLSWKRTLSSCIWHSEHGTVELLSSKCQQHGYSSYQHPGGAIPDSQWQGPLLSSQTKASLRIYPEQSQTNIKTARILREKWISGHSQPRAWRSPGPLSTAIPRHCRWKSSKR